MYDGNKEYFDIIDTIINKTKSATDNRVLHISDIAQAYYSRAQQLESASPFSFLGTSLTKKEDRMAECARIYLKLGDVKQFCEIMISLSKEGIQK